MKADATGVLFVKVENRAARASTVCLQGFEILRRAPHGKSIPSSDEVYMVFIRVFDILWASRSVSYPYDLPGMGEALQTLDNMTTADYFV